MYTHTCSANNNISDSYCLLYFLFCLSTYSIFPSHKEWVFLLSSFRIVWKLWFIISNYSLRVYRSLRVKHTLVLKLLRSILFPVYLSIYLFIYLSILSVLFVYLSSLTYMYLHVFLYLSITLSSILCLYVSIYTCTCITSLCLSLIIIIMYMCTCMYLSTYMYLPIYTFYHLPHLHLYLHCTYLCTVVWKQPVIQDIFQ